MNKKKRVLKGRVTSKVMTHSENPTPTVCKGLHFVRLPVSNIALVTGDFYCSENPNNLWFGEFPTASGLNSPTGPTAALLSKELRIFEPPLTLRLSIRTVCNVYV